MKGSDRATSSFSLHAASGLVLLRHSGPELVRPLQLEPSLQTTRHLDVEREGMGDALLHGCTITQKRVL
jgi:glucan biosynthesis protein